MQFVSFLVYLESFEMSNVFTASMYVLLVIKLSLMILDMYTADSNPGKDIIEDLVETSDIQYCEGFVPTSTLVDSDWEDPNPDGYFPLAESLKIAVSIGFYRLILSVTP